MPYSEAQKRATAKYKKNNYKRIPLDITIDKYEQIKTAAGTSNETINGYIKKAIDERLNK